MLSIITPTYYEAKNISNLIVRINNSLMGYEYELIIVDDASLDGTSGIARELSKNYPLKVILREKRLGLASAVVDGFKIACGDLLCVIDSDLSHPPEIIPEFIKELETQNADIVVASRAIKDGGTENWPANRRLISYLATLLAKPLTTIKDPMSGFFILKREVIDDIKLVPKGYKILLEILVKGKYNKVVEYPFIFKNRTTGSSKLNFKIYLESLIHLINLYFYKIK